MPRGWFKLAQDRLNLYSDAWRAHDEMIKRYTEKHRAYHNFDHIAYCLSLFEEHRDKAQNPDAVEFAIWLHDLIYQSYKRPAGLPGNEALSAAYADELLAAANVNMEFRQEVHGLIMTTLHLPNGAKTDDEKLINALQKSWKKMTPAAHAEALKLSFGPRESELVKRALSPS